MAYRPQLWREWSARGPVLCFACRCPVRSLDYCEVEHRISARLRPDLAWTTWWQGERFLVPVHGSDYSASGGVNKRCGTHDLACNLVIGSNAARRDELGRSLPLTEEEIAAAMARTRSRPRSTAGRDRRKPPGAPGNQRESAGDARNPRGTPAVTGRAW